MPSDISKITMFMDGIDYRTIPKCSVDYWLAHLPNTRFSPTKSSNPSRISKLIPGRGGASGAAGTWNWPSCTRHLTSRSRRFVRGNLYRTVYSETKKYPSSPWKWGSHELWLPIFFDALPAAVVMFGFSIQLGYPRLPKHIEKTLVSLFKMINFE